MCWAHRVCVPKTIKSTMNSFALIYYLAELENIEPTLNLIRVPNYN